jgi:uncharacterized damage-inducible protein DinB
MTMDVEQGSERELLEAHLDGNRGETVRKVTGLPWDLATRRLGPSATSAAGVLKHLIDVERWWFRHYLEDEPDVPRRTREQSPNGPFDLDADDDLESLIAEYDAACAESRAIAARHPLEDRTARQVPWLGRRPSLRWIYLHMIEETARHNGHLDIYRELLDGQVDD